MQTQHATLARLASASMSTGYTLSNAEMRLSLDRQLRSVASLPLPSPSPPAPLPQLSPAARAQLPAEVAAHIAILEARVAEQQRLLHRSSAVGLQVSLHRVPPPCCAARVRCWRRHRGLCTPPQCSL